MKHAWLGCLLFGNLLLAGTMTSDAELNVNSRYTVETVLVSGKGWKTDPAARTDGSDSEERISARLRKDLAALIGEKLNPDALDRLAGRLKKELHAREVAHHLARGNDPEHVRVQFDVKPYNTHLDGSLDKLTYNSQQGWSGTGEVALTAYRNTLAAALTSDGDDLSERYSGISVRYENRRLGTDRLRLRFRFDNFHEQWNANTLRAAAAGTVEASAAYRTRQNFQPELAIVLARPLTLTVGTSFERFGQLYPTPHNEGSSAAFASLRYHRTLEGTGDQQNVDAGYGLRAATRMLGSDFVYVAHAWNFRYEFAHGKHVLRDSWTAGEIDGRAPLSERFVLGNSSTLRGWNKFDLDPTGGNRMVHNSVEYQYGRLQVFYDSGAVWDRGQDATPRQSIGVGVRESAFFLAVAFPVRSGHTDPVFMVGMNY